jgi:hypothetical protein
MLLTMLDCCRFRITVPSFEININFDFGSAGEKEKDILGMNTFENLEGQHERKRIY